jgi:hypothetical protein
VAERRRAVALARHYWEFEGLSAVDLPATTVPGGCFSVPRAFTLANTTVRVRNYPSLDPEFSPTLSQRYWDLVGPGISVPDPTAPGFDEFNAAGFPRNQYVRSYVRRDGTVVRGYWRNSPKDGLPTCQIISCS